MIANLKPYAEYEESGLAWLGLLMRREEVRADILTIEKESKRLFDGLLKVGGDAA